METQMTQSKNITHARLFKSYYVVWKHDSQKIPVFSLICSNHTILNIPKSYKQ